jgi:hypothetical protein
MSTTFNLRSWSIDILNVTVIHHSSLWLSMCRSTMSTTFKSPIVVDRHTQFYCYPSFIIVTVDVSIDDVDDIQISDRRRSSYSILLLSIIHHCDCRSTMSTTFKSPIVVYLFSIIHHPSSIIHPCDCRNVDRRCRRPMIDDVKIVTAQFYCYPSWWMSICWSTIEDVKIVTDRDCRYMSIDDRRCRRPTMIDLKNRIRHGRFWDLSQCTGPKNKILARQKIFGTCPSGRLPKILARQITQSFACHLWPKIQISTSRKKI